METLSQKLLKTRETPYQTIAKQFNVSARFVGMIARGQRIPQRGKGKEVLEALQNIAKDIQ